jgi:hypothetical protein
METSRKNPLQECRLLICYVLSCLSDLLNVPSPNRDGTLMNGMRRLGGKTVGDFLMADRACWAWPGSDPFICRSLGQVREALGTLA